jgi:hypothetical protein
VLPIICLNCLMRLEGCEGVRCGKEVMCSIGIDM